MTEISWSIPLLFCWFTLECVPHLLNADWVMKIFKLSSCSDITLNTCIKLFILKQVLICSAQVDSFRLHEALVNNQGTYCQGKSQPHTIPAWHSCSDKQPKIRMGNKSMIDFKLGKPCKLHFALQIQPVVWCVPTCDIFTLGFHMPSFPLEKIVKESPFLLEKERSGVKRKETNTFLCLKCPCKPMHAYLEVCPSV